MKKSIKKCIMLMSLCSILTVSFPVLADKAVAENTMSHNKQPLDRIVAIVNDSVITDNELNAQVNQVTETLRKRNMPTPPVDILRKQVLQHMIDTELEMQMAKNAGIDVDSHDLDEAIDTIAKRNHITIADMQKTLESQGVSWKAYRRSVKKEVTVSRLQEKVVGQIIVTNQQVDDYLASNGGASSSKMTNTYHLEDILVPLPSNPTSEQVKVTEQQANVILQKLKQGANFNELAVAESGGESALQGGDLGFRRLAELPQAFANQVVNMQPGELAGPIRIPNGWHIIKLVAIQGGGSGAGPTKEQVRNFLYQRKYNEALQNWMMQIRASAYVKVFL